MMINPNDLSYAYNTKGYMLYYKNHPIGGAGISPFAKGCKANLKLFRQEAETDRQMILNGNGQKRYYKEINKIKGE